jgi:hypothetical protein
VLHNFTEFYTTLQNAFSTFCLQKLFTNFTKRKSDALKKYESQIKNNLIEKLLVKENLWVIKND